MMSCATLVWYFCGSALPCTVEIPRSSLNGYTPEQVRWAKACAVKHKVKWRVIER